MDAGTVADVHAGGSDAVIGLVLVSHSAKLADGARELASQMAGDVAVVAAGGDDEGGIGTSFERIEVAIAEADAGDGVVVLYDLGSAKLTSEMVLEMLDPDRAARVRLVDAPFVEGALAAATRIDAHATLDDVVDAARAAGAAFASAPEDGAPEAAVVDATDAVTRTVELTNAVGLHARPASIFARAVGEFDAQVRVALGGQPVDADFVNARSTLSVVSLGGVQGDRITIRATGPQAQEAVDHLVGLVEDRFGE
jgi:dihydroxyacetone kinase phosphotransfer subunit